MNFSKRIYEILSEEKIDLISTLPCNALARLFSHMPEHFTHIPLTREENGVGISAGYSLTGGKPLMMIQSTGLGNSINALMGLQKGHDLPLPIIASWRGRENDRPLTQVPLGKAMPAIFDPLEIPYTIIEHGDQLEKLSDAIQDAFKNNTPHVVLIPPEFWKEDGDKVTKPQNYATRNKSINFSYRSEFVEPQLTRGEAILAASEYFDDDIAITTIGRTCPELYFAKDRDLNFYVIAALGQASAVGLGMALNTDKNVYVLDGDGSLMMNPNILFEIALLKPSNLTVIVLDNGTHNTTGDIKTHAYDMIDCELLAKSCGIANTRKAFTKAEIEESLKSFKDGPNFLHVVINKECVDLGMVPLDPLEIKERFINALSQTK